MNRRRVISPYFQHLTQFFIVVILGVIVLGILFFLNEFKLSSFFPIKTVRVYGVKQLDHQAILHAVQPEMEQGFFGVHIDSIRDRLSQLPWVSTSYVRRNWPDRLDIIIYEKKPLALWNDRSLISESGELFFPERIDHLDFLPRFIGPNGTQMEMIKYFHAIDRLLQPIHAKILSLELTSDLAWKLMLTNGIIFYMGQQDVLTRLHLFVKVYPKIIGDHAVDVEYIDLRYSNGVAVKWKSIKVGKNEHGKEAK